MISLVIPNNKSIIERAGTGKVKIKTSGALFNDLSENFSKKSFIT